VLVADEATEHESKIGRVGPEFDGVVGHVADGLAAMFNDHSRFSVITAHRSSTGEPNSTMHHADEPRPRPA